MKTILVPVDFSPSSLNASNYALDLANSVNAELVLLHVFEFPVLYPETYYRYGHRRPATNGNRIKIRRTQTGSAPQIEN